MENNHYKLISKLEKIIKEEKFKQNILKLITSFINQYGCSWQLHKKYAIFTHQVGDCTYDLKIIFTTNKVQYVYSSSDIVNNETGIYKKLKTHIFTNIIKYTIENYEHQSNLTKEHAISVFNKNMIEQFKYTAKDYQSYYIRDGQKCFTPNDCLAFNNMLNIRKQIRTRENNIIDIVEKRYYNDNMKKNNEVSYGIAPNINNDPYSQILRSEKVDDRYIPFGGEYNSISHETYIDYMNGKISDEELFKNYKSLRRLPFI